MMSENSNKSMQYLSIGSCILSVVGALIIFVTFIALPDIRNFTRKLIVCLTMADFLSAVGYLFKVTVDAIQNTPGSDGVCVYQSFLTTFSSLGSFFLTISVSVHILRKTVLERPTERLMVYNTISWGLPLAIVLVARGCNVLGYSGSELPWCWIDESFEDKVIWMFITGKAWELLTYLVTFLTFIFMKFFLYRRMSRETLDVALVQEDRNFMYVWLVLYIIRLPGTLKFLLTLNHDNEKNFPILNIMQALGDPSQAFGNAILFCIMDKTVRDRVATCFRSNSALDESTSLLGQSAVHYEVELHTSERKGTSDIIY